MVGQVGSGCAGPRILILSFAQLAFLGDTDEQGGWINGLHGFLALIILLAGVWYFSRARRELGIGPPRTAASD
jgi:hypothetical protein